MAHPASFLNRPDGLSPEQRALALQPLTIPPGYGMRALRVEERRQRMAELTTESMPANLLQVWEPPRSRHHRYVVAVDVAGGTGLDDSVIDVTRVGTMKEPDEQVAQWYSNEVDTADLAYVADAIGRFYSGSDGQAALMAVECNGLGISTQQELIKHVGYQNLFIWEYFDAMPGKEQTTRFGWWTSNRSRPIMLANFVHAVKSVDPYTGLPDYRINSPLTLAQLADFISPGPLWMAEAADGAKDDAVLAPAIGVQVARTLTAQGRETVHDQRRRLQAEVHRVEAKQDLLHRKISPQNSDTTYNEMTGRDEDDIEEGEGGYYPHS